MKYTREALPNGLRLIIAPMPSAKSATVMVMVGAGSRYETEKNNGISHFLEHMAFKGTKKRPSALEIATLIDSVGGKWNAFTDREATAFFIKSDAEHIELSMDVLSDMLQNSLLSQKEIDKEKGVILEEMNMYEDLPMQKIDDVYKSLLYGNTPMGREIVGKKEVIKSIKRSDFTSYLKNLYSPSNMTVVVAGGVKTEKTKELVSKYFGKMKSFDILRYEKVIEKQKEPAASLKKKQTEQVHIALGFRTVALKSKDRYILSLLSVILGGNMSSRMFSEVREKRGLAYYIKSYSVPYQDCGSITTYAGVDINRIDSAISVILEEYEKIKGGKFSIKDSELKRAKDFAKGHLILELEDSRQVASFYAEQEILEKELKDPDKIIANIEKISTADIKKVANKYFLKEGLNLAVIGNFDSRQRFEKLLK